MSSVASIDTKAYFGLVPTPPKKELDMKAFLRLLVVQLESQNPLEPLSDRDFFAQLAQLGQVQGMEQMQNSLRIASAQALIGKRVTALLPMTEPGSNGTNGTVTGVAKSLKMQKGEYLLTVEGADGKLWDVKVDHVREVDVAPDSEIEPADDLLRASTLIGKVVTGRDGARLDEQGKPVLVRGVVQSVARQDGELRLTLRDENEQEVRIRLADVIEVRA